MPRIAVILPAAGKSTRFASTSRVDTEPTKEVDCHSHPAARKKPFVTLGGEPVWYRSVLPFLRRNDVVSVLLAVSPEDLEWFQARFASQLSRLRSIRVVAGGSERADTVELAIQAVPDDIEYIAVHDAARPLVSDQTIDAVIEAAIRTGAAIPATPISSTIKRVDTGQRIAETVPRAGLWAAQTPQIIRRDWLKRAFAERGDYQPTDEAQLIERSGWPVEVVVGPAMNLKVTTQDDLDLAEALVAMSQMGKKPI